MGATPEENISALIKSLNGEIKRTLKRPIYIQIAQERGEVSIKQVEFLTPEQLAELMHVETRTVYSWIEKAQENGLKFTARPVRAGFYLRLMKYWNGSETRYNYNARSLAAAWERECRCQYTSVESIGISRRQLTECVIAAHSKLHAPKAQAEEAERKVLNEIHEGTHGKGLKSKETFKEFVDNIYIPGQKPINAHGKWMSTD